MRQQLLMTIALVGLLFTATVPATAQAAFSERAELTSLPAIETYLRSIGVDPAAVVVQHGPLNYAGPNCPGEGWSCTNAQAVVQLSTSASRSSAPVMNIFDCSVIGATIPALNECLIIQSSLLDPFESTSTTNSATCTSEITEGPGHSKCHVRQSSKKGNNYASIRARITQKGSTAQGATQDAAITQQSDSGSNTAKIVQVIEQSMSFGQNDDPTQTQNARQHAEVTQSSGSGNNSSDLQQTQTQSETASSSASITQSQNTDTTLGRNQDVMVTQTSTTGQNSSSLQHLIQQSQQADCAVCTVNQSQGSSAGGQQGKVTQTTGAVTQTNVATLNEDQKQNASTGGVWVRQQTGPEFCCGDQIGGTTGNVNHVSIVSTQSNGDGITQNEQAGTCSETIPGATCSAHVSATQNGQTNTVDQSGMVVDAFQSCNNGFCGGD